MFDHIDEAAEFARSITNGQGADSTIITLEILRSEHLAQAFAAVRKAGTVVVTAAAPVAEVGVPSTFSSSLCFQKRIQGSLYGMMSPSKDVPRLLGMSERGVLKLDELITRTYSLDEINQGYEDMHAGLNLRGVITFD